MKGKKKGIGLIYALNGIKEAFLQEKNFRIHVSVTVVVLLASVYFQIKLHEWIFIMMAIALVWTTELTNSAIERIIDYVKPEIHPEAKIIKDLGAGIVLIAAIFAVIVGLIVFIPKI